MTSRLSLQRRSERGVALVALLALFSLVLVGVLLTTMRNAADATERDRRTFAALAQAKQGLVDFAVGVPLDIAGAKRPGDLPCPDLNNDGSAEVSCSTADKRLGRLPWKTLGLPDLRDGYGERLWYAVSVNFKNNPRTSCSAPGQAGCLNSVTPGTITVRDNAGNIINDGSAVANVSPPPSGVIAVVFSPGAALTRLGSPSPQDRSCSGDSSMANCQTTGVCTNTPASLTALCNPVNYLDLVDASIVPALAVAEDNANFTDSATADGFIAGPVADATGNTIVNDILLVVKYSDLMPQLEHRVAAEVMNCLSHYATANGGHYPWTAKANDYTDFTDQTSSRFGRVPDTPFNNTNSTNPTMGVNWTVECPINSGSGWWINWKDQVYYAVAQDYAPDAAAAGCVACLTVDPPSAIADKKAVVLVAGRPLPTQALPRSATAAPDQYLEDLNAVVGTNVFKQASASATFDDMVLFQ